GHLRTAVELKPIVEGAPFAASLRLRLPIVQGPMTRVSDTAEFASAIADGGALPMIAFALLKGPALERLLAATKKLLGDRPWGIGLLGFAPQALLDEQLACARAFAPDYAIIAGGRPDQAVHLEAGGVPTFLHVPSANLIPLFLHEGARRFIFEGRECGGHIGPLSSFVLWSTMVDRLLAEIPASKVQPDTLELIFAGGIHDAASSAMLQVIVAPLAALGVKVGILMGSAYLFTREIVATGAVVPRFQQEAIDCERTVNLESGPGHASRCAYTPFAAEFFRTRLEHRERKVPADESRRELDDLILGRLRIASKGRARRGPDGPIEALDVQAQRDAGMYMLGQVATLRSGLTDIASLHREVTLDAAALLERRLDERAPAAEPAATPVDVAVVGIGVALPKANSTEEYWANILDKVDAITEIPAHRWDWRLYYDADRTAKDKIYSRWGGFLDDMAFDPTRYGMPPKSIESVDPMQLMALEVAWRTLEDAGYRDRAFDRERASVIVGASGGTGDVGSQYGLRAELPRFSGELPGDVAERLPEWTEDSFAGILLNVIAGRIANRLNFGGVNFTTDAACASSLAAVYQGVTELTGGRSDLVIAGGVDTVQGPFGYLCFSKTQALSPRGRCATFDESADGIVISEGIAMVALKRLADAERDGDRIYAVIKGVGGSSDGNAKGLTAPLPAGQLRAMRRAYRQAGFGPASVGLFEAHGTGTVVGDTAELQSTTLLVGEDGGGARQAAIGSVKTMIGHTKATAGLAGLVKAALALHHRVLPPHRGVDRPLPILTAPDSRVYLVDEAQPWVAPVGSRRRAAVSSFGFGGTNFHVVLEEYRGEYRDWLQPATTSRWPAELLLWSDVDRSALATRLGELRAELPAHGDVALRDLAASLAQRWSAGAETIAIVAKDHADLLAKLDLALKWLATGGKALPPGIYHGARTDRAGGVAFLFPGQGSQYPDMLRAVAAHFGVCRETLSDADAALRDAFDERFGPGARLSHFILPRGAYGEAGRAKAREALTSTDVAQPALGAVEVAMLRLLRSLGVRADMLAGHSYGEFVALFAAGAIDFGSLMALSAARGRFIVDAARAAGSELGTMAAVQAPRSVVEDTIAGIDGVLVANHNAPLQSIVSGPHAGVAEAAARFAKAGIDVAPLPVAAAFHSSLVQPAQRSLAALIETIDWRPAEVPVYSNTTARRHVADVAALRRQMAEHLVRPVEFAAEIEAMHGDGARVFVEVGPKSVLSRLVAKILDGKPHAAIALDDGSGLPGLLNGLAQLACAGVAFDAEPLFAGRSCRIGDPARLESLQREAAPIKHAWMLNGSVARRAAEPVPQVGMRLEEVAAQRDRAAKADRPAATIDVGRAASQRPEPAPAREGSAPRTEPRRVAAASPRSTQ
nr:beta-ketoacyl synthase N-terminal-like domain-containing protein [Caldimonas sp.]